MTVNEIREAFRKLEPAEQATLVEELSDELVGPLDPRCPPRPRQDDSLLNRRAFPKWFRDRLHGGKYSRWSEDLNFATLEAHLWMVGEYGLRAGGIVDGDYPLPDIINDDCVANARLKAALLTIASVVSGERIGLEDALARIRQTVREAR